MREDAGVTAAAVPAVDTAELREVRSVVLRQSQTPNTRATLALSR